jgi:hypothetical protein
MQTYICIEPIVIFHEKAGSLVTLIERHNIGKIISETEYYNLSTRYLSFFKPYKKL